MKFPQIFRASIYEPKKLAAFRLLSIGKIFRYVFFFITLVTIISFTRFVEDETVLFELTPDLAEHANVIGGLIYPIAFLLQLVISTFYIFIRISVFAYAGILILKLLKRRGQYRHMWNTSAIASTTPILLGIILDVFRVENSYATIITSIVYIGYVAVSAKYYPKIVK